MLADVGGAKNAVYVHSYALGPSLYYGAGAGMLPTAMAVVSDMIEIGRNMYMRAAGAPRVHPMRPVEARKMIDPNDISCRYYLRFGVHDQPGVLGQLMTVLGSHACRSRSRAGCEDITGRVRVSPRSALVPVRAASDDIEALPIVRNPPA